MAGHIVYMVVRIGVYSVLMNKPEGKCPLGRSRLRCDDNNKIEFQEFGCGGMDCIELA